jgi:hypothetical protein
VEEHFYIDELLVDAGSNDDQQQHEQQEERRPEVQFSTNLRHEAWSAIMTQLKQMERAMTEQHEQNQTELNNFRVFATHRFSAISKSVARNSLQAPRQMWWAMAERERKRLENQIAATATEAGDAAQPPAPPSPGATANPTNTPCRLRFELSPRPKHLADLWLEYTHGIDGRCPAKDIPPHIRGKKPMPHTYGKRKHIWTLIARLVHAGYSPEAAIDRIYQTYGRTTNVTDISKAIVKDKKQYKDQGGLHPNFRL